MQKKQTSTLGLAVWFVLSGLVLLFFEWRWALADAPMWIFRVVELFCLLTGALGIGTSIDKRETVWH